MESKEKAIWRSIKRTTNDELKRTGIEWLKPPPVALWVYSPTGTYNEPSYQLCPIRTVNDYDSVIPPTRPYIVWDMIEGGIMIQVLKENGENLGYSVTERDLESVVVGGILKEKQIVHMDKDKGYAILARV